MKIVNLILAFLLAAIKSVNWISAAVNFAVILFSLVFQFKGWAVLFALLLCLVIIILDYSIPLLFKKKS